MGDTFLKIVDIDQEEDWAEHRTLGDSTEDDGKEGVYPVDSNDLRSVSEEAFNPGVDFTTYTIGPDFFE